MDSPYDGLDDAEWKEKTAELIMKHPLDQNELRRDVLKCWDYILDMSIGGYKVGIDIFPKPQIIGFFFHELICLEISKHDPEIWRCEKIIGDKDIVNLNNPEYSIEVKTSSHKSKIFGNRSYVQKSVAHKKSKSGYYLAVNFEKFGPDRPRPKILKIRFGWIDYGDWRGQKSPSGQQAYLSANVENYKLLEI